VKAEGTMSRIRPIWLWFP